MSRWLLALTAYQMEAIVHRLKLSWFINWFCDCNTNQCIRIFSVLQYEYHECNLITSIPYQIWNINITRITLLNCNFHEATIFFDFIFDRSHVILFKHLRHSFDVSAIISHLDQFSRKQAANVMLFINSNNQKVRIGIHTHIHATLYKGWFKRANVFYQ